MGNSSITDSTLLIRTTISSNRNLVLEEFKAMRVDGTEVLLNAIVQTFCCREFSKVDGEFWRCKAVLEKCYSEITLLQRLSSLNVQFKDACEEGNVY